MVPYRVCGVCHCEVKCLPKSCVECATVKMKGALQIGVCPYEVEWRPKEGECDSVCLKESVMFSLLCVCDIVGFICFQCIKLKILRV